MSANKKDFILIEDTRVKFKTNTFSNYKKSLVLKKLIHAMYYQKLEEAFFWTGELICTHLYLDLWNTYVVFYSKYIHISNPNLCKLLKKKFQDFKTISENTCNDYALRNKQEIRELFCFVTMIMAYSSKETILDDLNYKFNFKIENIYENLQAPNMEYVKFIYHQHDPKEYIIPFNELIYHLQETKNTIYIHYWINWIINYDQLCSSKKKKILCVQREYFYAKNEKQSRNIIWILWDIFFKISINKSQQVKDTLKCLLDLFCIKYGTSVNKRRKSVLYNCVSILCSQSIDFTIPILRNKNVLDDLEHNVYIIFEQLKKIEIIENKEESRDGKTNQLFDKMKLYENVYNNLGY